jgi:putative transcriptional regulator
LKSGKVKGVRFDTLERLCAALQCQPGDLLAYVPADPATAGPEVRQPP